MYVLIVRRRCPSPSGTTFDRHSRRIDCTNRSANALAEFAEQEGIRDIRIGVEEVD